MEISPQNNESDIERRRRLHAEFTQAAQRGEITSLDDPRMDPRQTSIEAVQGLRSILRKNGHVDPKPHNLAL